jgi:Zn-dependent protease
MQVIDAIFYIAILLMSVVIHEVSHGFMAEYFGDKTARLMGRLTLNPLKHLDFFGSIFLPIILFFTHAPFMFGWAKPVPYNPNNLRDRKWGTVWVAAAGVLSNFFIAIVFGLIIRLTLGLHLGSAFYYITSTIVLTNLVLGIFNLVPIPPLDGSKILFSFLPRRFEASLVVFEQYSFIILIIFIVYLSQYLEPVLGFLYQALTGVAI